MKELIEIQSSLIAPKDKINAFGNYMYRSCESILEALKPMLLAHKCTLHITDEVKTLPGFPLLFVEASVTIKNEAGDTLTVKAQAGIDINRKGFDVAQCFGASSSYARKYALSGMFLIDDTKDPDGTNDHDKNRSAAPQAPSSPISPQAPAPEAQRKGIRDLITECKDAPATVALFEKSKTTRAKLNDEKKKELHALFEAAFQKFGYSYDHDADQFIQK